MSRTIRREKVCTKKKCGLCKPHKKWKKTSKFDDKNTMLLKQSANIDLTEYIERYDDFD